MATSKSQPPQVNLKERIAALQQRNVSPGSLPVSPSVPMTPAPNSAGVRDRIAKFEKKGGVPIPRGSFGLGAPPLAENGPAKRRGELYGNRIPSAKTAGATYGSRSNSPFGFDSPRLLSTPMSEGEEIDSLPADLVIDPLSSPPSSPSPPPALSPQTTGNSLSLPLNRGTRFSVALQHARRVEGNIEASLGPTGPSPSSSPETQLAPAIDPIQKTTDQTISIPEKAEPVEPPPLGVDVTTAVAAPIQAPSIVLSPTGEVDQEQVLSDDVTAVGESAQMEKEPIEISLPTSEVPSVNPSLKTPTIRIDSPILSADGDKGISLPSQVTEDAKEADVTEVPIPTTLPQPCDEPAEPPSDTLEPPDQMEVDMTNANSNLSPADSTLSPLGPFSLANAVHDLGQVVANIHDMFPGQISPLKSPPTYRPLRLEDGPPGPQKAPKAASDELKTPEKSSKAATDLQTNSDETPSGQSSRLTTPRPTRTVRPVSMIETSPGQVAVAQRVIPATSRGVPILVPSNQHLGQPNYEHFPPTPEPNQAEFGSVTLHKASHSFSQSNPYANRSASAAPSNFTAVVHGKVPETKTPSTSSYQSFYTAPATPKNPTKTIEPPLMSPGFGELATLLHEAALLEFTLEQGQLPAEKTPGSEAEEKQESEKTEKERLEKDAAARAKVEEEKRKHEAVAKARAKHETRESKSRSSFRNPLLRSKTSHQRDASTDSTSSNNPARAMSVLLPFRPQPTPAPRQSSPAPPPSITSIPETEVNQDLQESDPSLLQTSPKSPRQLFAGLKRLASSSRSSTPTGTISRNSVSAWSEMSSEDSMSIPTPPGNGPDSANSEAGQGGLFGNSGLTWPSLSPKKSPALGRAASFADKMLGRGRTKSAASANTVYETIDRITRPAAAQIPPLDPISFSFDVSAPQDEDSSSPPELVSPRRSASLYVPSTSQFPPVYSARPTSSVYTPLTSDSKILFKDSASAPGLDTILSPNLKSPDFNQTPAGQGTQSIDAFFSVKPTSPVYTPHTSAMKSQETITDRLQQLQRLPSPQEPAAAAVRLPSPQDMTGRRSSWISDMSMDSSSASIPSPFFDAFPAVPDDTPMPPALPGRQRPMSRPSLPLPTPSFFEPAPLSSTPVGAEFAVSTPFARSSTVRSATLPRLSGEHYRQ